MLAIMRVFLPTVVEIWCALVKAKPASFAIIRSAKIMKITEGDAVLQLIERLASARVFCEQ